MTKVKLRKLKGGRKTTIQFRENKAIGKTVGMAKLPGGRTIRIIKGKILARGEKPVRFQGKRFPITQDRGFYDPKRRLIALGRNASKPTLAHELGHAVDHLLHPRKVSNAYRNFNPSRRQFLAIENGAEKQRKKLRIVGRI